MIWGAMSCRGAAGLYFIPPNTTMNGPKELYKEKLKLHIHVHLQNAVTEFLKK